jgi:tungstate transport system substrate-binding protein
VPVDLRWDACLEGIIMRIASIILVAILFGGAQAQERAITMASTTSTEQSGLFGYLLPQFSKAEGINVRVVAVGTGQALDIGRRGDADVVFVHDRPAEDKFMSEGQGVKRFDVMYNDFVIVGPKSDPAHIGGDKDVVDALKKITATKAPFIHAATSPERTKPNCGCGSRPASTSARRRTAGTAR